ncbi:hypothetical protein D3C87_925460 [compost metagenome]
MKNLNNLNAMRDIPAAMKLYGFAGDHECGLFRVSSSVDGATITVIATAGNGWDHVSASREDRCPTWEEMEQVKRLFFKNDETAFQLHVPPSDHISFHHFCLHLWRPLDGKFPVPPSWMVGPKVKAA